MAQLRNAVLVCVILVTMVCFCPVRGYNETDAVEDEKCASGAQACRPGIILPVWMPQKNISTADKVARSIVYFIALAFMFLGISIIADRFMAAIEVITSQEREVTILTPAGDTTVVSVRVWNETVSNLTLMALGSSAPEIMLSVIEIIGNRFEAGDLGPGTIVGSAAFNLFIIIGYCVSVVPDGQTRRIKHLRVFFVTATWSIFAYLWMYFIIAVSSNGVVTVWEGVITFIFFPVTVLMAYIADRRIFFFKFLSKKYRKTRGGHIAAYEGEMEMGENHVGEDVAFKGIDSEDPEIREFERHRKEYIEIMRELHKKHPDLDMRALEERAEIEAMNRGPKSRAFYRIQATRKLTGGGNIVKKAKAAAKADKEEDEIAIEHVTEDPVTRICFEPGHYTVMENVGTFECTVARYGGDMKNTIYVDYRTEDGTANAGSDYDYADGTLMFEPFVTHKKFKLSVIDDDVFEEDEHFYVRLSNIRVGQSKGGVIVSDDNLAQLANPMMATVMILDDDHAGIFHFEQKETTFPESIGEAQIKVTRSSGARGGVRVPYKTVEGTAKGSGKDYDDVSGELEFENDQIEAVIKVHIIDHEEYEKNQAFDIELGEPKLFRNAAGKKVNPEDPYEGLTEEERNVAELGRPMLGDVTRITCHIKESMEFKSTVDKLLRTANKSLVVGTSSWREQFIEAITVSAGDDDDDGGDEDGGEVPEKLPSCMDYVMHYLTVFWKVVFAFVPPTDYFGGWPAFTVSIIVIGILTALVGDLASHFGCSAGLKDSVTAISFVAMGTSLPDTFASKVAAINDEYADSSIGNVTGSNAVNVFLGIGIAWSIAAIYHASKGTTFRVKPGSLAFSVTIFCIGAFMAIGLMLLRRRKFCGGELGGKPKWFKNFTTCFMVGLWVAYIMLSSLETYCIIPGF